MFEWLGQNWDTLAAALAALGVGGWITKVAIIGKLASQIVNLFHTTKDTILTKWAFDLGKRVTAEGRMKLGKELWEKKIEGGVQKVLSEVLDSFNKGLNSDD